MTKFTRIIAVMLAIMILFSIVPVSAFAKEQVKEIKPKYDVSEIIVKYKDKNNWNTTIKKISNGSVKRKIKPKNRLELSNRQVIDTDGWSAYWSDKARGL